MVENLSAFNETVTYDWIGLRNVKKSRS